MKKKKLLEMIGNSIIMVGNSKEVCKRYFNSIENALYAFPDNTEIEISSVKCFKSKEDFDNYARGLGNGEIEMLYSNILSDVRTWIDNRPEEVAVINKRSRNKKVWFAIFTGIIIAVILAAIVLEGLKISGQYNETLGWVSDAVDGLGLVTGLAFFLYEKIDDRKKNDVHNEYEEAVKSGEVDKFVEKNSAKAIFGKAVVDNSRHKTNVTNNYYSEKKEDNVQQ